MMQEPESFAICAIWIYPSKDRKMMRILDDGLYYFNDCLEISNGTNAEEIKFNEQRLQDGWFENNISVQAIVGKNGSGKSSLLDYLYGIANNFGMAIEARMEKLKNPEINRESLANSVNDFDDVSPVFVADVEARGYFMKGNKAGG